MPKEIEFRVEVLRERMEGRRINWLAEKAGVPVRRLYSILGARRDEPSASELFKIAWALNADPAEFVAPAMAA